MSLTVGAVQAEFRTHIAYSIPEDVRDRCEVVTAERLVLLARFGGDGAHPVLREGVIDTGSPVSFFPRHEWVRFQDHIRWLGGAGSWEGIPAWLGQPRGFGGVGPRCLLGEILVEFIDLAERTITPPVRVLGRFADHDSNPPLIENVFGLNAGQFGNLILEIDFGSRSARLAIPEVPAE